MTSKKARILIIPMILALCIGLMPVNAYGASTAKGLPASFYVNESYYCTEAFTYGSETYYKLADVAYALKDTTKKMKVTANGNSLAIEKGSEQAFAKGIFSGSKQKSYTPEEVTSATYGGAPISGTVYKINGSFCMSAASIGKMLNIGVETTSTQRLKFNTGRSNTEEKVTGTVYTKDWPEGTYIIRYAEDPTKLLSVSEGSTADRAPIIIWEDKGQSYQQFVLTKNGSAYNLKSVSSGLNIRLGAWPGDKTLQMNQGPTDFTLETTNVGTRIKITGYVTYMGVSAGSTKNGTPLIAWQKSTEGSQIFIFEKID